jgi:hypothetical protein
MFDARLLKQMRGPKKNEIRKKSEILHAEKHRRLITVGIMTFRWRGEVVDSELEDSK